MNAPMRCVFPIAQQGSLLKCDDRLQAQPSVVALMLVSQKAKVGSPFSFMGETGLGTRLQRRNTGLRNLGNGFDICPIIGDLGSLCIVLHFFTHGLLRFSTVS